MGTPKRIYLQAPPHPTSPYERTWCEDQIDETDTEYVLASALADPAPASKVLARVEDTAEYLGERDDDGNPLEDEPCYVGAELPKSVKPGTPVTVTVEAREEES